MPFRILGACCVCVSSDKYFLDREEVQRASKIEVLDEFEEWELIMVSEGCFLLAKCVFSCANDGISNNKRRQSQQQQSAYCDGS